MKFAPTEVSIDAGFNVTVNGVYTTDAGVVVGGEVAFQFDPSTMPATKAPFLAEVKKRLEALQPQASAEDVAKLDTATKAKALLGGFVGTTVTLAEVVTK